MSRDGDARVAVDDHDRGAGNVLTVAQGAGFIGGGRLFSFVIRFLMAVLLARWLGVDEYGAYVLAISLAGAASSLASLGLDVAMERYVAVQMRRGDHQGTRGTLQVGAVGTAATSLMVGAALLIFAGPIARGVFDEPRLVPLLRLAAVLTPLLAVLTLLLASIRGFKRMDLASLGEFVVQPSIRFIGVLSMAAVGITAFRASVALGLSYAMSVALLIQLVKRLLPEPAGAAPARREVKDIVAFSFPFWFTGLMRVLRTRLQPLILGIFGTVASVGVFSVVTSANTLGRVANASIRTASRPTLAELHDAGEVAELGRLYATTTRWTLASNLPVFLTMVLMPTSLLSVFGKSFTEEGVTPLVIVAFAELVNASTGMCGPIIAMSSYNRMKVVNSFVWMVVSIGANVLLIPKWGVIGAAVAVLISTAAVNAIRVAEIWILLRILPWDRRVWKPIAAALATATLAYWVLVLLPDVRGVAAVGGFAIGISLVFALVFVGLGLEPDDRLLLGRIRRRVARRSARPSKRDQDPDALSVEGTADSDLLDLPE